MTIEVTQRRIVRGRPEVWEARTADGRFTMTRTEEAGTPWVLFRESDGAHALFGSLPKIEQAIASGVADRYLDDIAGEA